jgi:hypothetical protein
MSSHEPLYAVRHREAEWVAYEVCPIPGGKDRPIVARDTKEEALRAAEAHVRQYGSCFKSMRSVVGHG